jgi:hypothetical protein
MMSSCQLLPVRCEVTGRVSLRGSVAEFHGHGPLPMVHWQSGTGRQCQCAPVQDRSVQAAGTLLAWVAVLVLAENLSVTSRCDSIKFAAGGGPGGALGCARPQFQVGSDSERSGRGGTP